MKRIMIECKPTTLILGGSKVIDILSLTISPGITYIVDRTGRRKSRFIQFLKMVY